MILSILFFIFDYSLLYAHVVKIGVWKFILFLEKKLESTPKKKIKLENHIRVMLHFYLFLNYEILFSVFLLVLSTMMAYLHCFDLLWNLRILLSHSSFHSMTMDR